MLIMKSTVTYLSKAHKAALVHFYDSKEYEALKVLLEKERLEIAKDLLEEKDRDTIIFLQGQAFKCKQLHQLLQRLYKEASKES